MSNKTTAELIAKCSIVHTSSGHGESSYAIHPGGYGEKEDCQAILNRLAELEAALKEAAYQIIKMQCRLPDAERVNSMVTAMLNQAAADIKRASQCGQALQKDKYHDNKSSQ